MTHRKEKGGRLFKNSHSARLMATLIGEFVVDDSDGSSTNNLATIDTRAISNLSLGRSWFKRVVVLNKIMKYKCKGVRRGGSFNQAFEKGKSNLFLYKLSTTPYNYLPTRKSAKLSLNLTQKKLVESIRGPLLWRSPRYMKYWDWGPMISTYSS